MSETKKEFRYFAIPDWVEEQDYLQKMHRQGWKFVRVSGLCLYHFERCEPENVVYQLDYNPQKGEARRDYLQMFKDCGWEYLQDYVGYSYFRKPAAEMQGDEEIFCDDESRLDMMKRVFWGRMFPLLLILCGVILPNLYIQPVLGNYWIAAVYGVLLAVYLYLFIRFGVKLRGRWKELKQ